jgi:phosphopentomutase
MELNQTHDTKAQPQAKYLQCSSVNLIESVCSGHWENVNVQQEWKQFT